ncbi:coniferyl alcohol acyltransferase-like [Macadamia integrifolia]|uniref:coniferyl alcohol acyltransferase-like n=1 Tax=Macadamia integrifolia TaxID=60698 RepID=UPI001C4EB858|nr:coniferyl alcohol acyltransferase-like [Macadamia integrifolia]
MCLSSSAMGGGNGMRRCEDFKVEVKRKEVVEAALPLQEHWLPLSNLDLLLPALDVGVFFCYKKQPPTTDDDDDHNLILIFGSMVNILKKSLAQALVSYYLFAGELVTNSAGEPELLCNNRGVDFIEAYADVDLCHIDLHNPDATVEGKLVPNKKSGVLSVQATELRCGGIVVGCKFDHRIADAYSTNMFLVAWAEIARLKATSLVPTLRRSLLNPSRPLRYDPSLDDMYVPVSKLPPPPPPAHTKKEHSSSPEPEPEPDDDDDDDDDLMISRIYYVTAKDIEWIQSQASSSSPSKQQSRRSKLESFSALLWQTIAKSVVSDDDDGNNTNKKCKIGIVVDGRSRLGSSSSSKGGDDRDPMSSYLGNVLSIPFGEAPAKELKTRPLSWAAKAVHGFLESAVTKEHFLGLIDWVEAHRPEPALAKIYCKGTEDGPALVVSSGQRFPVSKVDFGWGKPVFGSYHFPWEGDAGYVMPMPSSHENGDWVVYMHLFKSHLELLEADDQAASIFRPFTSDYLLL